MTQILSNDSFFEQENYSGSELDEQETNNNYWYIDSKCNWLNLIGDKKCDLNDDWYSVVEYLSSDRFKLRCILAFFVQVVANFVRFED